MYDILVVTCFAHTREIKGGGGSISIATIFTSPAAHEIVRAAPKRLKSVRPILRRLAMYDILTVTCFAHTREIYARYVFAGAPVVYGPPSAGARCVQHLVAVRSLKRAVRRCLAVFPICCYRLSINEVFAIDLSLGEVAFQFIDMVWQERLGVIAEGGEGFRSGVSIATIVTSPAAHEIVRAAPKRLKNVRPILRRLAIYDILTVTCFAHTREIYARYVFAGAPVVYGPPSVGARCVRHLVAVRGLKRAVRRYLAVFPICCYRLSINEVFAIDLSLGEVAF